MAAIFLNIRIQNLHFLCRKCLNVLFPTYNFVLAYLFSFKYMKNNKFTRSEYQLPLHQVWGDTFPPVNKCGSRGGGGGGGQGVRTPLENHKLYGFL